jgi:hypothetical protein
MSYEPSDPQGTPPNALAELIQSAVVEGVEPPILSDEPPPFFKFLSPYDIRTRPPKQWLVRNLVGVKDVIRVFGPPNGGKTFAVLDLLTAAVKGECTFAKHFTIEQPLNVCYATQEGLAMVPKRILAAWNNHELADDEEARWHYLERVPQLFDLSRPGTAADFVRDYNREHGDHLDILAIDTQFTATLGANENDGDHAGRSQESIDLIRNDLGCAVVLIHHTNAGGERPRGHSSWGGYIDLDVSVKRHQGGETRALSCEFAKDASEFPTFLFDLEARGESVVPDWVGTTGAAKRNEEESTKVAIRDALYKSGEKLAPEGVADATGIKPATIKNALTQLYEAGKVKREAVKSSKPGRPSFIYWHPDFDAKLAPTEADNE